MAVINLAANGAVGDGVTDNYAVIQSIVDAAVDGSLLYLPEGAYRTTGTIDFGNKAFGVRGDGQGRQSAYESGSRLFGAVAGPILACRYPSNGASFSDLAVWNTHAAGVGMLVGGQNVALERLMVIGHHAVIGGYDTFTMSMKNIVVRPASHLAAGSIGIHVPSHTSVQSADVVGFDHGMRISGVGIDVRCLRVEVNLTGIVVGMNPAGQVWAVQGLVLDSSSFEANDVAVDVRHLNGSRLSTLRIQGTTNAPSGQSIRGIVVANAATTSFESIAVNEGHSDAAIKVTSPVSRKAWKHMNVSNTIPGGKVWDLPANVVRWGNEE